MHILSENKQKIRMILRYWVVSSNVTSFYHYSQKLLITPGYIGTSLHSLVHLDKLISNLNSNFNSSIMKSIIGFLLSVLCICCVGSNGLSRLLLSNEECPIPPCRDPCTQCLDWEECHTNPTWFTHGNTICPGCPALSFCGNGP